MRLMLGQHLTKTYTQLLGEMAHEVGFEAIYYESARLRGKFNLALFPENLLLGSLVELQGEEIELQCIELNQRQLNGYNAPLRI